MAENHDLHGALSAKTPLAVGAVMGLGFLLLLIALQAPLIAAAGAVMVAGRTGSFPTSSLGTHDQKGVGHVRTALAGHEHQTRAYVPGAGTRAPAVSDVTHTRLALAGRPFGSVGESAQI